jgi:hypothetical protein
MNPLSPSQSNAEPVQIAQGSGFDVDAYIDNHSGRSSMYDLMMDVREIPGRVGNSIKERLESGARDAANLFKEIPNKLLRMLQGGQQ